MVRRTHHLSLPLLFLLLGQLPAFLLRAIFWRPPPAAGGGIAHLRRQFTLISTDNDLQDAGTMAPTRWSPLSPTSLFCLSGARASQSWFLGSFITSGTHGIELHSQLIIEIGDGILCTSKAAMAATMTLIFTARCWGSRQGASHIFPGVLQNGSLEHFVRGICPLGRPFTHTLNHMHYHLHVVPQSIFTLFHWNLQFGVQDFLDLCTFSAKLVIQENIYITDCLLKTWSCRGMIHHYTKMRRNLQGSRKKVIIFCI